MGSYRVECGTSDTGTTRPDASNMQEFDADTDEAAVKVAVFYATSQHSPNTGCRLFRREFLGWAVVDGFNLPSPSGNPVGNDEQGQVTR